MRDDLVAFFVVVAGLIFALACNNKRSSGETRTEKAGESGSAANKAAALQVTAAEIIKDYKENEVSADLKYKDKIVQISGTIGDIKKDLLGDIYVTVGTGAQFEFPECQVFFEGDATKIAAGLKKGAPIKVKGKVTGLMMNVQVKDAVFLE